MPAWHTPGIPVCSREELGLHLAGPLERGLGGTTQEKGEVTGPNPCCVCGTPLVEVRVLCSLPLTLFPVRNQDRISPVSQGSRWHKPSSLSQSLSLQFAWSAERLSPPPPISLNASSYCSLFKVYSAVALSIIDLCTTNIELHRSTYT